MKQRIILWIENYLFYPTKFQNIISYLFLPLTLIYCIIIKIKKAKVVEQDFKMPIVSIGNIIVGGTGKTPIVIKLASKYKKACIILRGYKRASKGLFVVSLNGDIKVDIDISGDEAMMLAKALPNTSVIVSKDRGEAIKKAKQIGAEVIFLDDGYSKYNIKKYDILLRPKVEPTNTFCLPSGCYRDIISSYNNVNLVLKEGVDFKRVIQFKYKNNIVKKLPKNSIIITAISKPQRLKEFIGNLPIISFADHHNFTKNEIKNILQNNKHKNFATTFKDFVKLERFDFGKNGIYIIDLDIIFLDKTIKQKIKDYIENYN